MAETCRKAGLLWGDFLVNKILTSTENAGTLFNSRQYIYVYIDIPAEVKAKFVEHFEKKAEEMLEDKTSLLLSTCYRHVIFSSNIDNKMSDDLYTIISSFHPPTNGKYSFDGNKCMFLSKNDYEFEEL